MKKKIMILEDDPVIRRELQTLRSLPAGQRA